MRKFLWPAILGTLVIAVVAWQFRQSSQPKAVSVASATLGPLVAEWSAVGYVESRTAQVTAPQAGRIEDVLVREGDAVHAGQALAILARRPEQAGVALQRAGVALAQAQSDAARAAARESEQSQVERERRAKAETTSARERWRQAVAMLARSKRTIPAQVEAARSELEAARATLRDLEKGSRPEEIAQAEADLRGAESTHRRAEIELRRARQLFDEGASAQRDVDNAQEALDRADSSMKSRREALSLLKRGAREDAIAVARAKVRSAESNLTSAQGELAGLDAEARKVDEAAAALKAARAAESEVTAGRGKVESLRQEARAAGERVNQGRAGVDQAAAYLAERAVYASFEGVVGRRYVDPGDMATPAQPLFSIVESKRTWVSAEVDEQDLAAVYDGQEVTITAPAYAGREFKGKVARIGGEAVPQTEIRTGARIVRVRVSLDDTPAAQRALLKPGMEIHASGRATLAPKTILVPSDTLLSDADGSYVWLLENGKARRRRLKSGYVNGPHTEIVSGLRQGEKVILTGKEGLTEEQAVQVR